MSAIFCPPGNAYTRYITQDGQVDWVVVDRLIRGVPVRVTRAERIEAARLMTRAGLSAALIAERVGVCARSVVRYRSAVSA